MRVIEDYIINVAWATDVGCHRENNEDAVQFISFKNDRRTGLAIVADGMGGHRAGEVASQEAVEIIGTFCLEEGFLHPQQTLTHACQEANRKIYHHANRHTDCHGMGTTVTALMINKGIACYAHVGDSRLYRISAGRIEQLTQDHTLVAQLWEYGMITREQMRTHPNKNILTNALGVNPDVQVEIADRLFPVRIGETYLLCSDGLVDGVNDDDIKDIIIGHTPKEACNELIHAALRSGGYDNISVIVLAIENKA